MQSHPLDGDGVNFEIFKFLSKVSRSAVGSTIDFRIPDTVIFTNGCASFWYYFHEGTGAISRRPAKSLDRRTLYDFFGSKKKTERTDIVAQFTSWDEGQLTGTYMTKADLQEFLFGPRKSHHGIMQKFVEPREDRNDAIEVVWSPQMSFCVRRLNGHRVIDRNVAPTKRCATFDGASHSCEEQFCTEILRESMRKTAASLVSYVHEVDAKFEIGRLVAFFKQDAQGKVWLLYTTSIRIVETATDESRNTAAVSAEEIAPKPSLAPLLLTMHALDGSRTAKLRRGGQVVIAPPPRRLRGNFFTPAAAMDEDALDRASERKRERMAAKREAYAEEQKRLFGVLTKLRREVGSLHATLDAGQQIQRAQTASPGATRANGYGGTPPAPSKSGFGDSNGQQASPYRTSALDVNNRRSAAGFDDTVASDRGLTSSDVLGGTTRSTLNQSSPYGRRKTMFGARRSSRSPRRRKSHVTPVQTVAARKVEMEAAKLRASGDLFVKGHYASALAMAEDISDALYGVGECVTVARRALLERRTVQSSDNVQWTFALPRHVWRFLVTHRHVFDEFGVHIRCREEDRTLDFATVDDDGELAESALLRRAFVTKPGPTSKMATCDIVEPLPTAGALKRFANKVQTMMLDEAAFVQQRAAFAAERLARLDVQMMFEQLWDETAVQRQVLQEEYTFCDYVVPPPAALPVEDLVVGDGEDFAASQTMLVVNRAETQAAMGPRRPRTDHDDDDEEDEDDDAATPAASSVPPDTAHTLEPAAAEGADDDGNGDDLVPTNADRREGVEAGATQPSQVEEEREETKENGVRSKPRDAADVDDPPTERTSENEITVQPSSTAAAAQPHDQQSSAAEAAAPIEEEDQWLSASSEAGTPTPQQSVEAHPAPVAAADSTTAAAADLGGPASAMTPATAATSEQLAAHDDDDDDDADACTGQDAQLAATASRESKPASRQPAAPAEVEDPAGPDAAAAMHINSQQLSPRRPASSTAATTHELVEPQEPRAAPAPPPRELDEHDDGSGEEASPGETQASEHHEEPAGSRSRRGSAFGRRRPSSAMSRASQRSSRRSSAAGSAHGRRKSQQQEQGAASRPPSSAAGDLASGSGSSAVADESAAAAPRAEASAASSGPAGAEPQASPHDGRSTPAAEPPQEARADSAAGSTDSSFALSGAEHPIPAQAPASSAMAKRPVRPTTAARGRHNVPDAAAPASAMQPPSESSSTTSGGSSDESFHIEDDDPAPTTPAAETAAASSAGAAAPSVADVQHANAEGAAVEAEGDGPTPSWLEEGF